MNGTDGIVKTILYGHFVNVLPSLDYRGTQEKIYGLSESLHTEKKTEKDNSEKIRIKLRFPYVVPTQYRSCTAADTHLQNRCAVQKNKIQIALYVANLFVL